MMRTYGAFVMRDWVIELSRGNVRRGGKCCKLSLQLEPTVPVKMGFGWVGRENSGHKVSDSQGAPN